MNIENKEGNCISDILKKIVKLQKHSCCENELLDCSYPCLGWQCEGMMCNTRPITFYNNDGSLFDVAIDETEPDVRSSVFRVEKVNDNCATLRVLRFLPLNGNDTYDYLNPSILATNKFITVNVNCFCAIKCLNDVNVDNNILIGGFVLYKNGVIIDSENFVNGVHFFEAFDPDNEEINPTYRLEITLDDLTGNYGLKLFADVIVDNPNFIINSVEISQNKLIIIFTVNTVLTTASEEITTLSIVEDTEQRGLFTVVIQNSAGLLVTLAFLVSITNIYP